MLRTALRDIGIRPNLSGYHAIIRCMALLTEREGTKKPTTRDLCAEVAQSYGITGEALYKNMQYAIRTFWNHGNKEAFFKIARCRPTTCPTVGDFLDTLLDYLKPGPF
ncbi:hypothetical protein CE91St41_18880 [Oscillospiraceae bacterium]|nr:hypothetical protein CE91St40_18640 [Oscillospiraceae bacterium]BDF74999.1 hypothetical protein CE91St41_18880 [Oscillospiraceae bacterium]